MMTNSKTNSKLCNFKLKIVKELKRDNDRREDKLPCLRHLTILSLEMCNKNLC